MDPLVTAWLTLVVISGVLNMIGLAVFLGVLAYVTRRGSPPDAP